MSYLHIISDSGVIHAQPDDSDWTVCGKTPGICWRETDDPIACKVCKRSIELSWSHRVAKRLSVLTQALHRDMEQRPGAYLHADRQIIYEMKVVSEGE